MQLGSTLDMHPMFVDLEPAKPVLEGYPEAELDLKVFACIAGDANSRGVSFPTIKTMGEKLGETEKRVWQSVQRLIAKQLLKIIKKEKKYQDKHPRNIYQIVKALLRTEPDTRSSHFDAEKWKTIAARLKKFVADAVDDMKQVAAGFAQNMASAKKRKRKQNGSYQRNSYTNTPYYSYQNMRAAYPPAETGEKDHDGPGPLERRVMDSLFDLGLEPWGDSFQKAGHYMLDHLSNEPSDEEYDRLFQEAVGKFNLPKTPHVSQPVNNQSHPSHVRDVRMVSPGDDPMGLNSAFGAAFA